MGRSFFLRTINMVKDNGFIKLSGGKGSHEKWYHPENKITIIVPYNLYDKNLANKILKKDAKIDKKL